MTLLSGELGTSHANVRTTGSRRVVLRVLQPVITVLARGTAFDARLTEQPR